MKKLALGSLIVLGLLCWQGCAREGKHDAPADSAERPTASGSHGIAKHAAEPAPRVAKTAAPRSPIASGLRAPASRSIAPTPRSLPGAASPPTSADASTSVASPTLEEKKFTVVDVYYATDRAAVHHEPVTWHTYVQQFRWAGAAGLLAVFFIVVRLMGFRARLVRGLVFTSCTAAIGLILFNGYIGYKTFRTAGLGGVRYGGDRGHYDPAQSSVDLGMCQISIPKKHEVGELEAPSVWRLEFTEDPEEHVVFLGARRLEKDDYWRLLRQRVDGSPRKDLFVFVHGYNVSFEDAARRTGQMAYDLRFQGAPVFFSWPSQGDLLKYTVDETQVAWSVPHLRDFLTRLAGRSGARAINLIAHSMGNRALTGALKSLTETLPDPRLFHEVVLTAPDIDAEIFKRDIAPAVVRTARRVTLYASSNDRALKVSRRIHGHPRAGDSGGNLIVTPGLDTIDVTNVDTSLLGHSYYSGNLTVLDDLFELLTAAKPADERCCLRAFLRNGLKYWAFEGGHPLHTARGEGEGTPH